MKLIIFSGLPGTGKSKLADYVSKELDIPVFAKDIAEAVLWRNNIRTDRNSGSIAYDILSSLADEQLENGISVILDSVATSANIRSTWRVLAQKHKAHFIVVECICSEEIVHRKRLMLRKRDIDNWPELSWKDVLGVKNSYEPWNEKRLILDSLDSFQKNADRLINYLGDSFGEVQNV